MFDNEIVCGDAFELIKRLPDNSVNLVITSPPYWKQRDYGGGIGVGSLQEYVSNLTALARQIYRVLTVDGSFVLNIGDKYENCNQLLIPEQVALAIQNSGGFSLLNKITWVKTNPTPRQFERRLVQSTEPLFHFVISAKNHYYNPAGWIDAPPVYPGKPTENTGQHYRKLIDLSALTPDQKDRAHTALDGTISDLDAGIITGYRMKIKGIHAPPFGGQPGGRQSQIENNGFTIIRLHGKPIRKDVIQTAVESIPGCPHPATYPVELVKPFIRMLSRAGDRVLDPFMGAGTTAVACQQLERVFIGFELNPVYCQYAETRLTPFEER